jgi:hypothetical protein
LPEIKGVDIRRSIARNGRNQRRQAFGFLDKLCDLLETNDARIIARVYVKGLNSAIASTPLYTSAIQQLYTVFDRQLTDQNDHGLCLLDSRTKGLNVPVAHSIFTQKFKTFPAFTRIHELTGFVHSDNHAGVQIADILCSAIISSIAGATYSYGHVNNVHTLPAYLQIKQRYGARLRALQYRYVDASGRWRGGITVADDIGHTSGARMFI